MTPLQCIICLERVQTGFTACPWCLARAGPSFDGVMHIACLEQWVPQTCPLCRCSLRDTDLAAEYLGGVCLCVAAVVLGVMSHYTWSGNPSSWAVLLASLHVIYELHIATVMHCGIKLDEWLGYRRITSKWLASHCVLYIARWAQQYPVAFAQLRSQLAPFQHEAAYRMMIKLTIAQVLWMCYTVTRPHCA
jgi:hypothetical protein